MKWLIITAYFPPEIGSASFLFFELGQELVRRGHKVTVLTGFPKYNVDSKNLPLKYKKHLYLKKEISGMKVIRLKTLNFPRYIPIARGIDQFLTSFIFLIGGLALRKNSFDRILVYSPPLPLGLTAFILSKFKKHPFIFNVQDIFPQSAIDLGILKNSVLIKLFNKLERFIYKKASMVTVHSEGNRNYVISKGILPSKVKVIPNWVDTDVIKPGERINGFRREFGLDNQFIISFAGIIGYSQDLDTVINAAEYLKDYKNLLFLLIGDGVEKERLQQKAISLGLNNVRFIPMQPKEKYPFLLAASDVCLVTLRKKVKTPVVPSKLLGIMSASRPAIASLNLEGDVPKIINEAKCGICVEPENSQGLADAILRIYKNPLVAEEFGRNGRRYAEEHFSLRKCVEIYELL